MDDIVSGPNGPTTVDVRPFVRMLKTPVVGAPTAKTANARALTVPPPPPPVEAEYLRVRPFLALSGWSKSRLYRINSERWPLLIKVEGATFVVIRIYRRYMAACPRVGRAR
ncbi:MAG TPA: hypothetical protein VFE60_01380 [Roseiarcus sp.]|jgi:hypothetical protein|nr:hypothetical protein [Roseiarcus sp.]